ncbi:inhibin alpha chain [Periophthalmus magnuspinnatus]|uniref:inhibin alpha chain n=1 Tax=Periophthalmus magnuspinnatus TaxID=409849 RepID=UPI00145AF03E|nr:inhibin alpha chain [Periophthalmus magnuspinnatus]
MVLWSLVALLCVSGKGVVVEEDQPRDEVLSWVKLKLLEGLGVEEVPQVPASDEERRKLGRSVLQTRAERLDYGSVEQQDDMQLILFASSEHSCAKSDPGHPSSSSPLSPFTFTFHPSIDPHVSSVTSAQLWFFSGLDLPLNSSAPLSVLTSGPQPLLSASPAPAHRSQDGWSTYNLNQDALKTIGHGAFSLEIDCPECICNDDEDKLPFLSLNIKNHVPKRKSRSVGMPWSPSELDLLQRPSLETLGDCSRARVQISFEELGWDNWIVDPKTLDFYYCQGNCSSPERAAARLGMVQCCAPVPGRMRSVRITTTSDGGYSFKYETLPNIIPEECACI